MQEKISAQLQIIKEQNVIFENFNEIISNKKKIDVQLQTISEQEIELAKLQRKTNEYLSVYT